MKYKMKKINDLRPQNVHYSRGVIIPEILCTLGVTQTWKPD